MRSEPGGRELAVPSAVGHGCSRPHLKGLFAKCLGQGVGLGVYPQPAYGGASSSLPVALIDLCDWLSSLSIRFSSFGHIVACIHTSVFTFLTLFRCLDAPRLFYLFIR